MPSNADLQYEWLAPKLSSAERDALDRINADRLSALARAAALQAENAVLRRAVDGSLARIERALDVRTEGAPVQWLPSGSDAADLLGGGNAE